MSAIVAHTSTALSVLLCNLGDRKLNIGFIIIIIIIIWGFLVRSLQYTNKGASQQSIKTLKAKVKVTEH